MRYGYRIKDLTEQVDARPAEVKALFGSSLNSVRTGNLRSTMLAAELLI